MLKFNIEISKHKNTFSHVLLQSKWFCDVGTHSCRGWVFNNQTKKKIEKKYPSTFSSLVSNFPDFILENVDQYNPRGI